MEGTDFRIFPEGLVNTPLFLNREVKLINLEIILMNLYNMLWTRGGGWTHMNHFSTLKTSVFNGGNCVRPHSSGKDFLEILPVG